MLSTILPVSEDSPFILLIFPVHFSEYILAWMNLSCKSIRKMAQPSKHTLPKGCYVVCKRVFLHNTHQYHSSISPAARKSPSSSCTPRRGCSIIFRPNLTTWSHYFTSARAIPRMLCYSKWSQLQYTIVAGKIQENLLSTTIFFTTFL